MQPFWTTQETVEASIPHVKALGNPETVKNMTEYQNWLVGLSQTRREAWEIILTHMNNNSFLDAIKQPEIDFASTPPFRIIGFWNEAQDILTLTLNKDLETGKPQQMDTAIAIKYDKTKEGVLSGMSVYLFSLNAEEQEPANVIDFTYKQPATDRYAITETRAYTADNELTKKFLQA